jgi:HK97 family phage prohead protease
MFKNAPVQVKAAGPDDGLEDGQFRALVSVFGNVDSYGDKVVPGAFAKTLSQWTESGDPIPVYWSHRMDDPDMNIGYVLTAEETENGLEVLGQIDLDADASPKAKQAYRLAKGRRATQWSFAYDVIDGGEVDKDGEKYNELRELKLYEVSMTPIGANDQTELLAVKHAGQKADESADTPDTDALRSALESAASAIQDVLDALAPEEEPDDEASQASSASDNGPAKDEEPHGAKSEEPTRTSSVGIWEAHINLTELEGTTHAYN